VELIVFSAAQRLLTSHGTRSFMTVLTIPAIDLYLGSYESNPNISIPKTDFNIVT
jgi:hypothetical protein